MFKTRPIVPLAALALAAVPAAVQAQDYADLPPLTPMGESEVRDLPADMRTAPAPVAGARIAPTETVTIVDGVETITRTRYIPAPGAVAPAAQGYAPQYYPGQGHAAPGYGYGYGYAVQPAVFERDQWIEECRRRTRGQSRDKTGAIIGGLLGAIGGGIAGYEIAGAGDRVLGTVLGVGGGSLIGGLIGSLFDGDRKKNLYDCEAALDSYLTAYGAPRARSPAARSPTPTPPLRPMATAIPRPIPTATPMPRRSRWCWCRCAPRCSSRLWCAKPRARRPTRSRARAGSSPSRALQAK